MPSSIPAGGYGTRCTTQPRAISLLTSVTAKRSIRLRQPCSFSQTIRSSTRPHHRKELTMNEHVIRYYLTLIRTADTLEDMRALLAAMHREIIAGSCETHTAFNLTLNQVIDNAKR